MSRGIYDRNGANRARRLGQDSAWSMQGVAELQAEVRTLRSVLLHMLACQAQDKPVALHEEPLRSFLHLPVDITAEQALGRLARQQARVLGTVTCPHCGAAVQDREGVTDELCQWCGKPIATER